MPFRIQALEPVAGEAETTLHPATGLRTSHYAAVLTSDGDVTISAQPIGGAAAAAVTSWTEITIDGVNRVPFPSTLCAHIVGAPVGTVRFRISGYDQYGMVQVETTPSVALAAKANNYVYLSKIFSSVVKVEFQSTGLDIAADTINLGTRYDWTRTIDAANEHTGGLNLGVALFKWTGEHRQGSANPARHKLEQKEPVNAFEVVKIIQYDLTGGLTPEVSIPIIGQADGADWEASPDKWFITTPGIAWAVTDSVKVVVYQSSRAVGFHR